MNKFLIAFFASSLFLFACNGDKRSGSQTELPDDSTDTLAVAADSLVDAVAETPVPRAADELFDDFFFNFVANRRMQTERIHFPLPVYKGEELSHVEKKAWKMERFFMTQGYYTLIFDSRKQMELVKDTAVDHVVVEKIDLVKKKVKQYTFQRANGLWQLESIHHLATSETKNASFIDFYCHFASDSAFQLKSLNDPVAFSGPDPDDDFKQIEGVISPDTWPAFAPELPSEMIYNIIYGQNSSEGNRKIFLIRGIANGFEIEMDFAKRGGKWYLMRLNT